MEKDGMDDHRADVFAGGEGPELTVLILLFDQVEVLDFAGPFEVFSVASQLLRSGSLAVRMVGESADAITAVGGMRVLPDLTLRDAPPGDVVVVPGGDGSRQQMDNPAVLEWLASARRQARLVMSVCSGARILAKAGMLDGHRVTTHHQVVDHLRQLAPRASVEAERRFIDEGTVLTTAGISAGIDASFHVVRRLLGEKLALSTARYMEYDWSPTQR